ncbi:hypothetical protein HMPREF1992_02302 [Selenomonas sp. oral taxon 892 str. F0426]|nr:hypothetical protein HMPREF1992_02302 [Selenomonas sp. oral taxon 892 str. F0426]
MRARTKEAHAHATRDSITRLSTTRKRFRCSISQFRKKPLTIARNNLNASRIRRMNSVLIHTPYLFCCHIHFKSHGCMSRQDG